MVDTGLFTCIPLTWCGLSKRLMNFLVSISLSAKLVYYLLFDVILVIYKKTWSQQKTTHVFHILKWPSHCLPKVPQTTHVPAASPRTWARLWLRGRSSCDRSAEHRSVHCRRLFLGKVTMQIWRFLLHLYFPAKLHSQRPVRSEIRSDRH